jgi:hypothetical protein
MHRYLGRCFPVVTAFVAVLAATACSTPQGDAPQAVGPLSHPLVDPLVRINYLGEILDGSGRLCVPDLNGKMYLVR